MLNTILGTKGDMTYRFDKRGIRVPITIIKAEPNSIVITKDNKVQLTFGKKKKVKKTENYYLNLLGFSPRKIKQLKTDSTENLKSGETITVSAFEPQDEIKISGVTKGKGFAGGIKRWGFHGGPKTHGQSDRHRAPGSIGQGTTPGRVFKGKKMAGHLGNANITVTGIEVIEIDEQNNLILVKGPVPGAKNGILMLQKVGKVKGYTPPPPPSEEKAEEKEEREEKKEQEEGSDESQKPEESKETNDGKGGENADNN